MHMYYYVFGGIILILCIWAIGSYLVIRSIEEPTYTVLEKRSDYEIRQYETYIIAETEVNGTYDEATNNGFRIIADYIFGNNTSKESISMTTPVLEESSEKIAMTTPVINTLEGEQTRTISFVLPSKYTLETLPTPNNPQVTLTQIPSRKVAVKKFTWYATENRVAIQKEKLQQSLARDEENIIGKIQVARYNPPLSMPLTLRNEIIVEIE